MDHLDKGGGHEPTTEGRIAAREDGRDAADVEDVDVVGGKGGRRGGGGNGGDADLQELDGSLQPEVALEVEGDDAGVGGIREDAIESLKGGEGDGKMRVVGRARVKGVGADGSGRLGDGSGGDGNSGRGSEQRGSGVVGEEGARLLLWRVAVDQERGVPLAEALVEAPKLAACDGIAVIGPSDLGGEVCVQSGSPEVERGNVRAG